MHLIDAIARGQLVKFSFYQDAVADSQTAVAMNTVEVNAGAALTALGYVMPFDYDLVAITCESDSDRTAGALTVDATINGTVTGIQAILNATTVNHAFKTAKRGTKAGKAGDRIGVKLTTASWTPVAADIAVEVYAILRLDGI